MEKSALAQEKVWFDKPSYDKAERLYFERMAKVVSHKIMVSCSLKSEVSVTNNYKDNSFLDNNSLTKNKSEKSKDIKSLMSENITNAIKNTKCQVKAPKAHKDVDELNIQKKENVAEKQKCNNAENVPKEKTKINFSNDASENYNTKEVKEKKNKADTRHRNKKQKDDTKKVEESVTPLIRNKQQGNQQTTSPILFAGGSLANEVAKARQHIKQSLQCVDDITTVVDFTTPNENKKDVINFSVFQELKNVVENLGERVKYLEDKIQPLLAAAAPVAVCPAKPQPVSKPAEGKTDDDGDVDLFGSDSEGEDADAAKLREERLAAYAAKIAKKPAPIAKSNIILDVKPWDDETDMKAMEEMVRKIEVNGLLWGASKLVPLAFGIHKLQISCVVDDDKVSVDWLTEQILEIEDYVQSVDIAAFNKV
ncbi:PREDICTED: probable elongation factor 1-delta isoform X1 [Eufriesea mexicana]|uniref:probable elongation factor 1-delta isoform X1 n=1 Tax=Eufriesea mexicana TaxID=516756 RepID=UPI00083C83B7|nr:PREDICTED: probable elongation factor 1-delta isoform X1 [Eufriesea mexicana]XP_017761811.1 PREDICTED: probable elongation factor 1-delta isoform X1 [Eufriesea mexicana]XP_017761813.1 PREDICTED: probable elongation factor 1-delta isoform X1 [Eufriesea mexicana]